MTQVEGQVDFHDKLTWIPSPVESTRCLIIAHGGKLRGDGKFKVPADVEIRFAVGHGGYLPTSANTALNSQAFPHRFTAGEDCQDYSLAKFVGHPSTDSYITLRNAQWGRLHLKPDNCPHIVSIRHRAFLKGYSKLITLSEVVEAVRQYRPQIDIFLVNACRGESDGILGLMKAAVFGV